MSLIPRPPAPGDRINWRPRPAREPLPQLHVVRESDTVLDLPTSSALDIDAHRAEGIRRALDHLVGEGTPAYRRQRALMKMQRSVELQAVTAGLGHLHVGSGPCGVMCEPLEVTR